MERPQGDMSLSPTPEEIAEEQRRLRWVGILADLTVSILYQQAHLQLSEAMDLVNKVRGAMLSLFPGKELAYDLIYRPRFHRAMCERFGSPLE